jgi:hypothetical protein
MIIILSNFRFVLIQIVIKHLTSYSNPSPSFMETWSIKNTFFFTYLSYRYKWPPKWKVFNSWYNEKQKQNLEAMLSGYQGGLIYGA